METSTKNLNFEFIDDPALEDFTNGTIDFVFNGRTHKIYKQILSPEDDYCIHCLKDKTKDWISKDYQDEMLGREI